MKTIDLDLYGFVDFINVMEIYIENIYNMLR